MTETNPLFSLSLARYIERYRIAGHLDGHFALVPNLQDYLEMLSFPLRVDAFMIAVCTKGEIRFSVNRQEWSAGKGSCFISVPEHVMGVDYVSEDYQGYLIAVSRDYLRTANIDLKNIFSYYVLVRDRSLFQIPVHHRSSLLQLFELISYSLQEQKSGRREEIVRELFSALVYKICDGMDEADLPRRKIKTKSKEYYFTRFMSLLWRNFRRHRSLKYYAGQLSVTPKYLSLLIKEISGTSAAEWIDIYTVMEASVLLKFSDKSIQQVADELFFPTQSSFSNYFKHNTGQTPSQYRQSMKKS